MHRLRVSFLISLRMAGCSSEVIVVFSVGVFMVFLRFTWVASYLSSCFSLLCELDECLVSGACPCISWSSSSIGPAAVSSLTSGALGLAGGTIGVQVQEARQASSWASVVSRRFSSDQRCSLTAGEHDPAICSDRCSSVMSLLPCHTACVHLSTSFGAGVPEPSSHLGKMSQQGFGKLQHFPR